MNLLVAVLLLAEPSPRFTVRQGFTITPHDSQAAPVVIARPQVARKVMQVRKSYPPGYHEHECPRCHTRWGGPAGSHGHNCPNCGTFQNVHASGPFRLAP